MVGDTTTYYIYILEQLRSMVTFGQQNKQEYSITLKQVCKRLETCMDTPMSTTFFSFHRALFTTELKCIQLLNLPERVNTGVSVTKFLNELLTVYRACLQTAKNVYKELETLTTTKHITHTNTFKWPKNMKSSCEVDMSPFILFLDTDMEWKQITSNVETLIKQPSFISLRIIWDRIKRFISDSHEQGSGAHIQIEEIFNICLAMWDVEEKQK
jgi:hypothetical protein